MQHLKNIKSGNPKTKEQYQLTKNFDVIWLWSEDGKNWYEEVKNFQTDTIKIVYDANNIIVAITKDASTLNPEGYSVVEVPDITANRRADDSGKWMFRDGAVVKRIYSSSSQQLYHLRPCVLFALKQMQAAGFSCCSLVASQERKHHHD